MKRKRWKWRKRKERKKGGSLWDEKLLWITILLEINFRGGKIILCSLFISVLSPFTSIMCQLWKEVSIEMKRAWYQNFTFIVITRLYYNFLIEVKLWYRLILKVQQKGLFIIQEPPSTAKYFLLADILRTQTLAKVLRYCVWTICDLVLANQSIVTFLR